MILILATATTSTVMTGVVADAVRTIACHRRVVAGCTATTVFPAGLRAGALRAAAPQPSQGGKHDQDANQQARQCCDFHGSILGCALRRTANLGQH